ncbi:MAG: DUF2303 family protein [Sphingomonas fennica]
MGTIIEETVGGVVAEARDLVETYVKAEVIEVTEPATGVAALVIRAGNTVIPLSPGVFDPYRTEPLNRHGTATMLSLASLIEHINRTKDDSSVIFADDDRSKPSIVAVLDYHHGGGLADAGSALELARFGKHRSAFAFPLSDEWKAWIENNAKPMDMVEFAAFLEERLPDVLALIPGEDVLSEDIGRMVDALGGPDIIASPGRLMELSRGLQVNENSRVREVVNLATGEGVVQWEATHTDETGAPLRVPKVFLIGIPVFRNDGLYRIAARLRYRKREGGRIVFWYELWRTDRTFDHAFQMAVERVRVETDLPVLIGRPEA